MTPDSARGRLSPQASPRLTSCARGTTRSDSRLGVGRRSVRYYLSFTFTQAAGAGRRRARDHSRTLVAATWRGRGRRPRRIHVSLT